MIKTCVDYDMVDINCDNDLSVNLVSCRPTDPPTLTFEVVAFYTTWETVLSITIEIYHRLQLLHRSTEKTFCQKAKDVELFWG